jgi:hypothetical protein
MIAMRTIHYGIRLVLVLIGVSLFYLSVTTLFHQAVQLPVLLTLLFITLFTERLWALLAWLSPIIGTVDTEEQERVVEYELARSQRYDSHLVIAAIHEKKRIALHFLAENLRTTDIVLRNPAGYLLILMPGITVEQASSALKRLNTVLPIKDIVVADEKMLQIIVKAQRIDLDGETRNASPSEIRKICIQAFYAKFASIKSSANDTDDPGFYSLLEPAAIENIGLTGK